MFSRSLYRLLSFYVNFRLGSLKEGLSMFLNDFHLGLLSKGRHESADGDHDYHLRHHRHNHHHYHRLWRTSVERYHILRPRPQVTRRPTRNSHKKIHNDRGEGQHRDHEGWDERYHGVVGGGLCCTINRRTTVAQQHAQMPLILDRTVEEPQLQPAHCLALCLSAPSLSRSGPCLLPCLD